MTTNTIANRDFIARGKEGRMKNHEITDAMETHLARLDNSKKRKDYSRVD